MNRSISKVWRKIVTNNWHSYDAVYNTATTTPGLIMIRLMKPWQGAFSQEENGFHQTVMQIHLHAFHCIYHVGFITDVMALHLIRNTNGEQKDIWIIHTTLRIQIYPHHWCTILRTLIQQGNKTLWEGPYPYFSPRIIIFEGLCKNIVPLNFFFIF